MVMVLLVLLVVIRRQHRPSFILNFHPGIMCRVFAFLCYFYVFWNPFAAAFVVLLSSLTSPALDGLMA